jgi:hypothetical protein
VKIGHGTSGTPCTARSGKTVRPTRPLRCLPKRPARQAWRTGSRRRFDRFRQPAGEIGAERRPWPASRSQLRTAPWIRDTTQPHFSRPNIRASASGLQCQTTRLGHDRNGEAGTGKHCAHAHQGALGVSASRQGVIQKIFTRCEVKTLGPAYPASSLASADHLRGHSCAIARRRRSCSGAGEGEGRGGGRTRSRTALAGWRLRYRYFGNTARQSPRKQRVRPGLGAGRSAVARCPGQKKGGPVPEVP